jgi:hypothetical protein
LGVSRYHTSVWYPGSWSKLEKPLLHTNYRILQLFLMELFFRVKFKNEITT